MTGTLSVEYLEKIVALSERLRDEWQQVNKKYKERHQVRKLDRIRRCRVPIQLVDHIFLIVGCSTACPIILGHLQWWKVNKI